MSWKIEHGFEEHETWYEWQETHSKRGFVIFLNEYKKGKEEDFNDGYAYSVIVYGNKACGWAKANYVKFSGLEKIRNDVYAADDLQQMRKFMDEIKKAI